MDIDPEPRDIKSRVIRPGEPVPEDWNWEGSTVDERLAGVWELTKRCLELAGVPPEQWRVDRTVCRVIRPEK